MLILYAGDVVSKLKVETADHALRNCPDICEYWVSSAFGRYLTDDPLHVWVEDLLRKLDMEECCLFATTLWVTWWGRNELVFRGKGLSHEIIYQKYVVHREQYLKAVKK
ncbi:hypothetical protein ACS0TY_020464 [Phlomoides rotata]